MRDNEKKPSYERIVEISMISEIKSSSLANGKLESMNKNQKDNSVVTKSISI